MVRPAVEARARGVQDGVAAFADDSGVEFHCAYGNHQVGGGSPTIGGCDPHRTFRQLLWAAGCCKTTRYVPLPMASALCSTALAATTWRGKVGAGNRYALGSVAILPGLLAALTNDAEGGSASRVKIGERSAAAFPCGSHQGGGSFR